MMLLSLVVIVYNVYRMIKPNCWMDARDASEKKKCVDRAAETDANSLVFKPLHDG